MLGWMWLSSTINGLILAIVIAAVYLISLLSFCDGNITNDQLAGWKLDAGQEEHDKGLMRARTTAFIALVWAENVRAYISRSFHKPVWVKLFANSSMQKAICLANVALLLAVFVPGFNTEILKLDGFGIGAFGWLMGLAGPIGCLVLCEAFKLVTAIQMRSYQRWLAEKQASRLQEVVENVGGKIVEIEKKISGLSKERIEVIENKVSGLSKAATDVFASV